jgi:hypothetical protein
MNEINLQWIQLAKLLLLAVCATLYGFGGVSGKWKRRYVAPCLATAGIAGICLWMGTFKWLSILYVLPLVGAYSIGYGTNSKLMKLLNNKVLVRLIVGLALGIAAFPIAIAYSAYLLWALHITICVLVSTVSGAFNPMKSARAEETMIGASSLLTVLFMF